MIKILSILTLLSTFSVVFSQENTPNTDSLAYSKHLEEFVVTGQYVKGTKDQTIHRIEIIDRATIDKLAAQNLRDVLTNQLNIRLSEDNILGTNTSMQGINGENIKILVDGVPVIGRLNGNIDLSQINLSNIEKIEIIQGPMSVNFGTNALGGVINLISKNLGKEKFSVGSNNYYESSGHYNFLGNIGYQKNKTSIALDGGRNFFGGWSPKTDSRFLQWKPKEQYLFNTKVISEIANQKVTYQLQLFDELITNRGVPLSNKINAFDDYYRTNRLNNAVNIQNATERDGWNYNIMLSYGFYKRNKNTYYRDLNTLTQVLTTNEGDQDTTAFKTFNSRGNIFNTKAKLFKYELGYDFNLDYGSGLRLLNEKNIQDYAIFGSSEIIWNNLTIKPGIRIAYNTQFQAPIIPSLSLRYKIKSDLIARASVGFGFRAPSLKELYFYFVDANHNLKGNTNLKPEKSINISGSLIQKSENINHEFSFFVNDIQNMINLALSNDILQEYTYVNIGKFKTIGLQYAIDLKLNSWNINTGVNMTGRQSKFDNYGSFISTDWQYSPELKASIGYNIKKYDLNITLFYKYNSSVRGYFYDAISNSIEASDFPSYQMSDLSIHKTWKIFKIGIGIKNLFDVSNLQVNRTGIHNDSGLQAIGVGRVGFLKLNFGL
jgi:outer membrane receptor for ferrienterochelin and colicins